MFKAFDFHFIILQGQDGVDLEINLNGGKSRFEDDDLDNMVLIFLFHCFFSSLICLLSTE